MYKVVLPFLLLAAACGPSASVPESATTANTTNTTISNPPAPTAPDTMLPEPTAATAIPVSADWLIAPGQRIGQTTIGDDPQGLMNKLGRPDASDAAMGKAWLVWNGRQQDNTLAVFTTYADTSMRRKAVRQIRITSSRFQTAGGIRTGTKLTDIRTAFPELKLADNTLPEAAPRYDAVQKGISFEISPATKTCTAIIVYPAGGSPTAYLPIPE